MKILYLLIATLKFLGIAILLLLLLLLLLVIIVLTVPIKYSIYVNKSDEIYVHTTLKWLYSVVGMDIIYNNEGEITKKLKLFGIGISPRKPKKPKKSTQSQKPKESKAAVESKDFIGGEIIEAGTKPKKRSRKAKKEKKPKKNKGGFKDIINQIQSFIYKKEFLTDTIGWIGNLIKSIRPSTLYMEIEIGKENPADTGQLIGTISALYPLYYSFANIVGNYEKECFYVKLNGKGDISVGKFVYDFVKYIRRPSVRGLIKLMRKDRKGKNNGRKVRK